MKTKLLFPALLLTLTLTSCGLLKRRHRTNSSESTYSEISSEHIDSDSLEETSYISSETTTSSSSSKEATSSTGTSIEDSSKTYSSEDLSSEEEISVEISSEQSIEESVSEEVSSEDISSDEEEESSESSDVFEYISLSERELILEVNKKEDLIVNFYPDTDDLDLKDGTWESSDESVATVKYGRVTAVSKGRAVISYTTTVDNKVAYCTVTVVNSMSEVTKEYVKVDDVDTITVGDQLVFACPEFGVAASINRLNRHLLPTPTTFSGDGSKITALGEDAGEFYVGQGSDEFFTLENQNNEYLAGKQTSTDTTVLFVKSKGQINWFFEKPDGYEKGFCVNYDIADSLWLMFNKINDDDIRFNLYDSDETKLMKLPTIYRLTITSIN